MIYMTKKPENEKSSHILCKYAERARICLKSILQCWNQYANIRDILIPAYIGVSPNEGSGLMDPIMESERLRICFYRVDRALTVDMADLKTKISAFQKNSSPFIFLRVNWFGFYDPNWESIDDYVHQCGGYVIEDNAHAFFSSFRHLRRRADAAIYSLHKAFPFHSGGMLHIYNPILQEYPYEFCHDKADSQYDANQYDFSAISELCRNNFMILEAQCQKYADDFQILRTLEGDDITVPQSFPVILKHGDRFQVYLSMNKQGYGVTSLYHTMIPQLIPEEYPDAAYVSERILNFPVHQDIDPESYSDMLKTLSKVIREQQ